jgi:hypothetical protein
LTQLADAEDNEFSRLDRRNADLNDYLALIN